MRRGKLAARTGTNPATVCCKPGTTESRGHEKSPEGASHARGVRSRGPGTTPMASHDDTTNTSPRGRDGGAELDRAIADILQESRRALAREAGGLSETPGLRAAVERAARAAETAGLGATELFAALDAAVTELGHEVIPNDGEAVRGAVAALLLRVRVSGERNRLS
jgi:hypothetical protein